MKYLWGFAANCELGSIISISSMCYSLGDNNLLLSDVFIHSLS